MILKTVGKRKPNELQTERTAKENQRKFATCLMRYFLFTRLQIQMVKVRNVCSVIGWSDLLSFRYSAQLHTPAVQLLKQQTMKSWKRKRHSVRNCKEFLLIKCYRSLVAALHYQDLGAVQEVSGGIFYKPLRAKR